MTEKEKKYGWEKTKKIFELIEKEQDFLCVEENLSQLAYIGHVCKNLFYTFRLDCECLTDYVENINYKSKSNKKIIRAAILDESTWSVVVSLYLPKYYKHYEYAPPSIMKSAYDSLDLKSDFVTLLFKPNKTIDEWISCLCNKKHQHSCLFDIPEDVVSYLLFCGGNGYEWTDSGFLSECFEGVDTNIFGIPSFDFSPNIKKEMENILTEEVVESWENHWVEQTKKAFELQSEMYKKIDPKKYADVDDETILQNLDEIKHKKPKVNVKMNSINWGLHEEFPENVDFSYVRATHEALKQVEECLMLEDVSNKYGTDMGNSVLSFFYDIAYAKKWRKKLENKYPLLKNQYPKVLSGQKKRPKNYPEIPNMKYVRPVEGQKYYLIRKTSFCGRIVLRMAEKVYSKTKEGDEQLRSGLVITEEKTARKVYHFLEQTILPHFLKQKNKWDSFNHDFEKIDWTKYEDFV